MEFDLDNRRARLGVGELAAFGFGPRDSSEGPAGLWRAKLGNQWHTELRHQASAGDPGAEFEVGVEFEFVRRGWTIALEGRIDQLIRGGDAVTLREIKTVIRALPEDEAVLRADYPAYFVQLAAYAAMIERSAAPRLKAELVFVEVAGGLVQTVALAQADEVLLQARLEAVAEFLDRRMRAREGRRKLCFRPPFTTLRSGQEVMQSQLSSALSRSRAPVLFEAPTGFGKTGVMLEFALGRLRSGEFDRVLYLTGKSTGQLQVVRTLETMLGAPSAGILVWAVRPKAEHCVNHAFHCLRDSCRYLDGMAGRWAKSGLERFYLAERQPRDLESLRAAGQAASICPYEITRAALAFSDVWIADYNYVFSPANRSLFYQQAGFEPARTLLLIDEAHNLPGRIAAAYSHELSDADSARVREALAGIRAPSDLSLAWEAWHFFLAGLGPVPALAPEDEAEARTHLARLAGLIGTRPLDYATLGPQVSETLWEIPFLAGQIEGGDLPRLWWCPGPGSLALTCLDAAAAIGPVLGEFGAVMLATATPGPAEIFAEALGLEPGSAAGTPDRLRLFPEDALRIPETSDQATGLAQLESPPKFPKKLGLLTQRETGRLFRRISNGADLLRRETERGAGELSLVQACAPWRAGAYSVACDVRVDTRFRWRSQHFATTADTVFAFCARASEGGEGPPGAALRTAVFFSSYAYGEAIVRELAARHPDLRVALQPRLPGLSSQSEWFEKYIGQADVLFLILGSSFAESVDFLGGRVTGAMVVGPALPEVSAVQRARAAALAHLGRDGAFDRVYRIPGMQKVNQALGRLVRSPGQKARVLLHCRRFAEPDNDRLLAEDYRHPQLVQSDAELAAWLGQAPGPPEPRSQIS